MRAREAPAVALGAQVSRFAGVTPVIAEVQVADDPEAWRAAGFTVGGDGVVVMGRTRIRVVGDDPVRVNRPGLAGWTLAAVPAGAVDGPVGDVDGLPTEVAPLLDDEGEDGEDRSDAPGEPHANGVSGLDHVVVLTPDLDRTTEALAAIGLEPRRTREAGAGPDGVARLQRFFRMGDVILEVVGPEVATPDGPARFWGLACVVDDLDATADRLGDLMSRPRDAVQPGRRIAALRPTAGLAVPIAFITPDRRAARSA